MVWITEAWDAIDGAASGSCVSWRVLPLLILEGILIAIVLWRIGHQVYWKSHPRRIFFHAVLLLSCVLRVVFWLAFCRVRDLFAVGMALLWWSNSLLLLCTASIIVQWWCAVSAGRVAIRELLKAKKFSLQHPLVLLHVGHLACATVGGIFIIKNGLHTAASMESYVESSKPFLLVYRIINMTTAGVDAVVAVIVATKLRARLLSAAMADDMKKKSVIQMTLLMICITTGLVLQMIMDVPVLVTNIHRAFGDLRFSLFCVVKYFIPAVLLSVSFLYIMRRVEQRMPVRLVVMPTASSLVDYEECASPCMWCEHHRRYNVGANKWDVNLMTSISPRTVDSSFRTIATNLAHAHGDSHGGHAHGHVPVLGSGGTFPTDLETPMVWPSSISEDTPGPMPTPPGPSRTYSGRRVEAGLGGPSSSSSSFHRSHQYHQSRPSPSRTQVRL